MIYTFNYTGSEQYFTVPTTGKYKIKAIGGKGGEGNKFGVTNPPTLAIMGANGASIEMETELTAGEVLRIVVAGKGEGSTGTAADGAAGGGGGATFVFREIPAVTESRWQIEKSGQALEVMVVAAGGNGTYDLGQYPMNTQQPLAGQGVGYKNPLRYTAYDTAKEDPDATNTSLNPMNHMMGIQQYIDYDARGTQYIKNGSHSQGGYGCGSSHDTTVPIGGGWSLGENILRPGSWCISDTATGTNGVATADGNGICIIESISGGGSYDIFTAKAGKAVKIKEIKTAVNGKIVPVTGVYTVKNGLIREIKKS